MSDPNDQAQTPEQKKAAAALAFKKDQEARALQRRKERSRHEAAHVVVGDAIKEDMEWVNVDGKPGVDHSMVHFNYSAQALSILNGNWYDTPNERKKAVDLELPHDGHEGLASQHRLGLSIATATPAGPNRSRPNHRASVPLSHPTRRRRASR
jgi:hypothetical protein